MSNPYNGFSPAERDSAWVEQKKLRDSGKISWKDLPCEMCEQLSPGIMPHLENYFIVDVFNPLCVECHMKLHARFSNPGAWIKLLCDLRDGHLPKVWISYGQYFKANNWKQFAEYRNIDPTTIGNQWWHKLSLNKNYTETLKQLYSGMVIKEEVKVVQQALF